MHFWPKYLILRIHLFMIPFLMISVCNLFSGLFLLCLTEKPSSYKSCKQWLLPLLPGSEAKADDIVDHINKAARIH